MNWTAIHAWLADTQTDTTSHTCYGLLSPEASLGAASEAAQGKRRATDHVEVMSSPTKRPRPSSPDIAESQGTACSPQSILQQTPTQASQRQANDGSILPPTSLPFAIRARNRSESPKKDKIRNIPDLSDLAVPVEYDFPLDISHSLRHDPAIFQLYGELVAIEHDHQILPSNVRGHIERLISADVILPCMWNRPDPWSKAMQKAEAGAGSPGHPDQVDDNNVDGEDLDTRLHNELAEVKHIVQASVRAFKARFAESHWNSSIHQRVLELALRPTPSVGVMNVTRAPIAEPFRPRLAKGNNTASLASSLSSTSSTDPSSPFADKDDNNTASNALSSHKMVDFVLLLETAQPVFSSRAVSRRDYLTSLVDRFLDAQAAPERWINNFAYVPLRKLPAAVFIETKSAAGRSEDGFIQLAICVAGWHRRMRALLAQAGANGGTTGGATVGGPTVLSVPVIMVLEGNWDVLFAVDGRGLEGRVDEIQVVGPAIRLGNTYSIVGMYRLLAGLRAVANWMDAFFRPWIMDALAKAVND